jgi:hypothetical protein
MQVFYGSIKRNIVARYNFVVADVYCFEITDFDYQKLFFSSPDAPLPLVF